MTTNELNHAGFEVAARTSERELTDAELEAVVGGKTPQAGGTTRPGNRPTRTITGKFGETVRVPAGRP